MNKDYLKQLFQYVSIYYIYYWSHVPKHSVRLTVAGLKQQNTISANKTYKAIHETEINRRKTIRQQK